MCKKIIHEILLSICNYIVPQHELTPTAESDLPTVSWRHHLFQRPSPDTSCTHTHALLLPGWAKVPVVALLTPCAYFSCWIFTLFYNFLFKDLSFPVAYGLIGDKTPLHLPVPSASQCFWHVVGAHQVVNEWWNSASFMEYHLERKWQSHPDPSFWSETRTDFRTENPRGTP